MSAQSPGQPPPSQTGSVTIKVTSYYEVDVQELIHQLNTLQDGNLQAVKPVSLLASRGNDKGQILSSNAC